MYCMMDVTLYCHGDSSQTIPRFQAMLDDLAGWIRERHPDIEVQAIDQPVTEDDLHIGFERGDLPDD